MAVYLVSLNRLAGARAGSGARTANESDRAATNSEAQPSIPPGEKTENAASTKAALKAPPKRGRKSSRTAATTRKPARTPRVGESATAAKRSRKAKSTRPGGEAPGAAGVPEDLACTVEELLHLPRTQVGALLETCGEPTRKVMLALIYRLAALEDELRGVSAKVRSSGTRAVRSATFRAPSPPIGENDKTGLLEQVFQKNVSLRKQK